MRERDQVRETPQGYQQAQKLFWKSCQRQKVRVLVLLFY